LAIIYISWNEKKKGHGRIRKEAKKDHAVLVMEERRRVSQYFWSALG